MSAMWATLGRLAFAGYTYPKLSATTCPIEASHPRIECSLVGSIRVNATTTFGKEATMTLSEGMHETGRPAKPRGATESSDIRPFKINFPEEEIADLRRRI